MGRVAAPHGVRGAVRVMPLSGDPAALLGYCEWWLQSRAAGAWKPVRIVESRIHSSTIVAVLEGVDGRDAAGTLRGAMIGVPQQALPPLGADELYQANLIGMAVVNRAGERLGSVVEFVESGAHPIVRVAGDGDVDRLIPWIDQYVERVDTAGRQIDVDWPLDY